MELTKEETQELIDQQVGDIAAKYGNSARLQVLQIISLAKTLYSTETTRYIPVPDWNVYHNYPTVSGLRNLIAKSNKNGFDRVILRKGKRVFIDEAKFFEWFKEKTGV